MEVDLPPSAGIQEKADKSLDIEIQGQKRCVTREQAQVIRFLDDDNIRVLAVQAPTGTGKTDVIALYLLKLMETLKGAVLVTAPTNLAVQEITEKVLNRFVPKTAEILFLQSVANEVLLQQTGK